MVKLLRDVRENRSSIFKPQMSGVRRKMGPVICHLVLWFGYSLDSLRWYLSCCQQSLCFRPNVSLGWFSLRHQHQFSENCLNQAFIRRQNQLFTFQALLFDWFLSSKVSSFWQLSYVICHICSWFLRPWTLFTITFTEMTYLSINLSKIYSIFCFVLTKQNVISNVRLFSMP